MLAGFSKFNITPIERLSLSGYIKRGSTKAKGVHDEIFGRICVLKDKKIIILILLELLAVDLNLVMRIKKRILKNTRWTEVIICCTHTHSGPEITMDNIQDILERDKICRYREYLIKKIEVGFESALEELNASDDVKLYYGEEEIEKVATNRFNPKWVIDNKVHLILIKNKANNKIRGCMANFACHPTVLGYSNLYYSGDLFGYTMKLIEKEQQIICLLTNGAEGDVSTRFTRREKSFREVERIASILAQGIKKGIERSILILKEDFDFHAITFKVPIKKIQPLEKIRSQIKQDEKVLKKLLVNPYRENKIDGLKSLEIYYEKINKRNMEKINIIGFKLGRILFVSIPGELTQGILLDVRQNFQEDIKVLILGLANDYLGYFPTVQLIQQEAYEAICSRFDEKVSEVLKEKIILLKNVLFY